MKTMIAALILGIALSASGAYAEDRHHPGKGGSESQMGQGMGMMDMKPHIAGMAEKLHLSEEQQDKLKALHTSYKKDMIEKKADREIAEIDLQELIQQEEPDLDAIEEQIREIADLEAAVRYAWVKLWIDAKSLLTEEQRPAFKELMKNLP